MDPRRRQRLCSRIDRETLYRLFSRHRYVQKLRSGTIPRRYRCNRRPIRTRTLHRCAATHEPEHRDQQRNDLVHAHCLHALQNDSTFLRKRDLLKRHASHFGGRNLSFLGGRRCYQEPTAPEQLFRQYANSASRGSHSNVTFSSSSAYNCFVGRRFRPRFTRSLNHRRPALPDGGVEAKRILPSDQRTA